MENSNFIKEEITDSEALEALHAASDLTWTEAVDLDLVDKSYGSEVYDYDGFVHFVD
jgi:hypothetical protein